MEVQVCTNCTWIEINRLDYNRKLLRTYSIAFHPVAEQEFISGGWNKTIQFYDARVANLLVSKVPGPKITGNGLSFHSSGKEVRSKTWISIHFFSVRRDVFISWIMLKNVWLNSFVQQHGVMTKDCIFLTTPWDVRWKTFLGLLLQERVLYLILQAGRKKIFIPRHRIFIRLVIF